MSGVAGLRGTGDWGTDERPKNFRETILFRNPNGSAPIFALSSRGMKKETTDDPEFSWWDEPNDIVRLQVNGALGSGDTTVVIDSADPTSSLPDNRWGTATHLKPGDHLLVEPAADVATWTNEVLEVVGVQSDTTFTVKRGAQGTTPASIADNLNLLLIGSAYSEGSASPQAVSRNPIKYTNKCQIFKTAYEITSTAEATRARTGDAVQNDKKRKAFDHSRDIEHSIMFGAISETTGANGKPLRTMDGLRSLIPGVRQSVLASTTVTNFLNAVYPVFDFDSAAGDDRIAFCGNGALNALNLMIQTDSNTQIQFGGTISTFGMNFREFVMPQGRLLLRTHPLLNRHALYTNSMFIVDFTALKWRPLRGRDTKFMDNIQNNDEDLRKGQWLTEASIELWHGGLTCAYVGKIL